MEPLCTNLRLLRALYNYSQRGVAHATGIKQQTISEIERGRCRAHYRQIKKLAACFNLPQECLCQRQLQKEMMEVLLRGG